MIPPALSEIEIRRARPADAAYVAAMVQLSMGSLAEYLFGMDSGSILEILEKLFLHNAGRFGRGIAFVAQAGGGPLGAMVACEGGRLNRLNLETVPPLVSVMGVGRAFNFIRRVLRLPGGREAGPDEYYIGNLGVDPSAQGRGVGSQLIAFAEGCARVGNLAKCGLIVGLHNQNALRLYLRLGYQIVETVQDEYALLGYHRMLKVL